MFEKRLMFILFNIILLVFTFHLSKKRIIIYLLLRAYRFQNKNLLFKVFLRYPKNIPHRSPEELFFDFIKWELQRVFATVGLTLYWPLGRVLLPNADFAGPSLHRWKALLILIIFSLSNNLLILSLVRFSTFFIIRFLLISSK